ncbi:hypothetical protein [Roseobacter litoralis]|uniref:Uncharacterized protein n=1 Tax=Roseobacter litoralis (strain ATCC 49566 / DSM 6996 / JCM 21268 / NBRC 15278 / OCh 149) TaxID=391595 RepID=F7ZC79_ROSLO|nr:hypothetical protein [Roseobacter litoralis]AEI95652.1 hypothetical protein RLO149_c037380 [Roseobacter litoralis Och 149]
MSLLRTSLRHLMALFVITVGMASAAVAACSDFDEISLDELAPANIREVQLGLRTAYRDPNPALADGKLGRYTRERLRVLCEGVPRPDGLDEVRSTLRLTIQYARLQQNWPGWSTQLFTMSLPKADDPQADPALALRLAGTTAMTTLALGRRTLTYDCATSSGVLSQIPDADQALNTLTTIFRDKSEVQVCELLPVAGGLDAWQQGMERLGQIEARRPGALGILESKDFITWIAAEKTENRLRRLVGTVDTVIKLIEDYAAQAGVPAPYTGGPCSPQTTEETLTYYALEENDVADLSFLVSLTPILEGFRAEKPGYDSPQALWRDLRPVLAVDLGDCILDEIEKLVTGNEKLPLSFLLRPSVTDKLQGNPAFETALPVVESMITVREPTKAGLVNRIQTALMEAQKDAIDAEVDAAADVLAAASEPVPPPTDTALLELDTDAEPDPTPRMTVTDATDQAVASAIDNPELSQALQDTPLSDVTVPELMRAQARAALEEAATAQAERKVEAQVQGIEPSVTSDWTLTEALQKEILALPFIQATIADATAEGLVERLAPLTGVAYPSRRLFTQAVENVSELDGKGELSRFVTERLVQKAEKTIDDPQVTRIYEPLEIEDCDCVSERVSDDLQVYGFYPFWLAQPPAAKIPQADPEAEEEEPKQQTKVDFSVVDHIAFYGLEFSKGDGDRALLYNRGQWRAARRQFINSAHQYRAKAELAFDLRDWMDWTRADIEYVVDDIATEMGAFNRVEGRKLEHVRAAIPTLFDPMRPDGVTLIFHDYKGTRLTKENMRTMVSIIRRVYQELPDRETSTLNVAFDFPVVAETEEQRQEGVFDDLYELLVPNEIEVLNNNDQGFLRSSISSLNPFQNADAQTDTSRETVEIVNKILLFLERPTSDAKKDLRVRMEEGLFRGTVRADILRSIIPVVPPGGHRFVKSTPHEDAFDTTPPKEFSQFEDDVVYFKDNFSGIGFWPVLDPLSDDNAEMTSIIAKYFDKPLAPALAGFEGVITSTCNYWCPNRAKITLGAIALFVLVGVLTWRSFYSGLADQLAFRFMWIGLVWSGNVVLIGTLFILATCDPHAVWPGRFMWALIWVLGFMLVLNSYQRFKNGPMP